MSMCDRCLVSGCCLTPGGKACKSARERECPDVVFTNADRIRAMNDDELAELLADFENGVIEWEQGFCDLCMQQAHYEQRKVDCMECLKKWLHQAASEAD